MDPLWHTKRQWIYESFIYLCGFLLFMEWLYPLRQITDTEYVSAFIIYSAFCFIISFLRVPWYIGSPLKMIGLAFVVDQLFMTEPFLSSSWLFAIKDQLRYNWDMIMGLRFDQITPFFRSILFLVLLWLMSYLLYYWFVVVKRIHFFVILTFVYVTVLDTFTVFDGKASVIRVFLISLIVMGVSSIMKELKDEEITVAHKRLFKGWMYPLVMFILGATILGYASPKLTSQWPDPVPFIQSATEGLDGSNEKVQKVGYGTNDEQLGGSFIQDNTLVFQVAAEEEHYWRIETKDFYTGKGWINAEEGRFQSFDPDEVLPIQTFNQENVETEKRTATVLMIDKASFTKLVYPYGIERVNQSGAMSYNVNATTNVIQPMRNGRTVRVGSYEIDYNQPSYSYQQLQQASEEDPLDIEEQYTQLPESLPNRVENLARNLVEEEDNRYDKAKAIEEHFATSAFRYDTEDVPVPEEEEDYVDQFLFDSQVGYCDNYSSSMVVMLRSVGIPARWAKGFTGGERIDSATGDDGKAYTIYEVKSENAHSWVEVYFPQIGWVPFEPTKGFGNHTEFYTDEIDEEEREEVTEELKEKLNEEEQEKPELQQLEEELSDEKEEETSGTLLRNRVLVFILIIAVVTSIALYVYRFPLMRMYYRRRFLRNPNASTFTDSYFFLMKVAAAKLKIKRNKGQTLREYAMEIDRYFQSNQMSRLTHQYERLLYNRNEQNLPWDEVTELWEDLINKTLS
ncbi:transglutaminase-like domain-containing protein [Pontibacillus litoralis]|uniref:Peptidase n=1 Tax=Pontibacillus litoralis JSM 072002 TaxID=1385512 RepID=A0A0A5HQD7_9BACI|nr:transglutaminase-like domain-containing protein [Pontibacillus litoralis]KGX85842.1 peptidase [Pontibacillus litoralis JSM 072002]